MKAGEKFLVVLVTAPNLKTARKLTRGALQARLAACVNIVPKVESHYWWNGKLESSAEFLLILKTLARKVRALEKLVIELHPYDTPEFIALALNRGNRRYLDWLRSSCETIS